MPIKDYSEEFADDRELTSREAAAKKSLESLGYLVKSVNTLWTNGENSEIECTVIVKYTKTPAGNDIVRT